MAKLMEAQGLLFCDVSDYTVFVNQLKEGELRFYAEVYEGFLKKMMELRYAWKGKYLANRMGDGFLWLDFDAGSDGLSLLDFSEQALMPLAEAFLKSVKVLADRPGLRAMRQTLLVGPVPYAEVRLADHRPDRLEELVDLGCRKLKGLEAAVPVWGFGPLSDRKAYYGAP